MLDTADVRYYSSNMQRRLREAIPATTTKAPGRTSIADNVRVLGKDAPVRDVVLAGGFRRLTAKEMFQ